MQIISNTNMREHHQERLKELFPEHRFTFVDKMNELSAQEKETAEVFVTFGRELTPALLEELPNLKWIQAFTAGMEQMPLEAIKEKDILLTNVRGLHGIQMAEYTLAMILNLVRRHYIFYDLQREKTWDNMVRIDEAYGKTVGIVGLGAIGQEIAMRAHAFGMRVIGLRRHPAPTPSYLDMLLSVDEQEKLFRESDFVVVLLPHTPETEGFVGAEQLSWMKKDAYLINIARGPVVDEEALLNALREEQIAGAVLDVFNEEPLPSDHPFWNEKNVIITPHISGRSPHYMQRAVDIFIENLKQYPDRSQMENIINLDLGY